jgi:hypothetical protein
MKVNAAMMCLAAAMLSFPFPAYLPYWLFGLSVLLEIILAGKLSSVTTLLAGQVSPQVHLATQRLVARRQRHRAPPHQSD